MIRIIVDRTTTSSGDADLRDQRIASVRAVGQVVFEFEPGDSLANVDAALDAQIARALRREADALALEPIPEADERIVRAALERYTSVAEAARAIDIGRTTLYRRIKALGLNVKG